jgi:hypothetical protein
MIEFDITIDASGPVFDGRWAGIMYAYCRRVEEHIGNEGVRKIRTYLPTQYMYLGHNGGDPTHNPIPQNAGYLVSQIHWDRSMANAVVVNDGGYPAMIYGPWIEGIGPGNFYFGAAGRSRRGLPARFPGYHAFRKATFELNMEAVDLAEEDLPPFLAALND